MSHVNFEAKKKDQGYTLLHAFIRPLYGRPIWPAIMSRYTGYGSIDVFYFDFYSIALSKIQRGSTRDINDVKLLLQQKIITLEGLDTAYNEILPRVGKRPYNRLDPAQFAKRYADIRKML